MKYTSISAFTVKSDRTTNFKIPILIVDSPPEVAEIQLPSSPMTDYADWLKIQSKHTCRATNLLPVI